MVSSKMQQVLAKYVGSRPFQLGLLGLFAIWLQLVVWKVKLHSDFFVAHTDI